jgi:hypothetical protein
MNKQILFLPFRLLLVAGCALGLVLNMLSSKNLLTLFMYYTIQSNLLCLAFFIYLLVRRSRPDDSPWLSIAKGACLMAILVTLLVYHFALRPQISHLAVNYRPFSLKDLLVHYFTPLMVLLDYLLFDLKGRYRQWDPLIWASLPLAYLALVYIYVGLGGRFQLGSSTAKYPYFFLNVEELGLGGVLAWIGLITGGFMVVAYGLVGLDWLLGRHRHRRAPGGQSIEDHVHE